MVVFRYDIKLQMPDDASCVGFFPMFAPCQLIVQKVYLYINNNILEARRLFGQDLILSACSTPGAIPHAVLWWDHFILAMPI